MENFALENLNEHRRGLLGKTLAISDMLTWSKVRLLSLPVLGSHAVLVVNINGVTWSHQLFIQCIQCRIIRFVLPIVCHFH